MITNSINLTNFPRKMWVHFMIAAVSASLISGCSGRKDVVTQDDSAEYRDAKTLPPLKKPSGNLAQRGASPEPQLATQTPQAQQAVGSNAINTEPSGAAAINLISASVVEKKGDSAQLKIDADFDRAWVFMRNNLNNSDITVHSRNKAAGRVLIGCKSIDEAEEATADKKGGWSIFKRSSKEDLTHCALQLVASKKSTLVNVLNRSGEFVPAAAANAIFSRLLNN